MNLIKKVMLSNASTSSFGRSLLALLTTFSYYMPSA